MATEGRIGKAVSRLMLTTFSSDEHRHPRYSGLATLQVSIRKEEFLSEETAFLGFFARSYACCHLF
jgi:hypothetical protein